MKRNKTIAWIPALLLLATVAYGWSPAADEAYERGRDALDRQSYKEAYKAFRQSSQDGGDQADAATYWMSYSLARMDRVDEAVVMLDRFDDEHPDSRWSDDARRLRAELSHEADEDDPEAEMRLIALYALIEADPQRAQSALKRFLEDDHSNSMKEEALFLLLQSGAEDARAVALDLARNGRNEEMRVAAIHSLAMLGESGVSDLADLYDSFDSAAGKRAILKSYLIAGDKQRLLDVARNERDAEIRLEAVEFLGAMGAVAELEGMYDASASPELQQRLLEAYMIAGNTAPLIDIARGNGPAEVRRTAVEMLGIMGEDDELASLYRAEKNAEVKGTIMEAMAIAGNRSFLNEVVRTEDDPEVRAEAIHALGILGGGSASDLVSLFRSEKNEEVRRAALEGLMMQGSVDELIELARAEKDPQTKKMIVEMLAASGSEKAVDFLMELIDG